MTPLGQLIADLVAAVPDGAGGAGSGIALSVAAVELELPIETRFAGGEFGASLPRGRWRTGIEQVHGTLHLRVDRGEP